MQTLAFESLSAVEKQLTKTPFLSGDIQGPADNDFLTAFSSMYPKLSAYLKSTEIQIKKNDFPIKEEIVKDKEEEIVEEIYEDPVLEALKEKKISEIAAIYLSKQKSNKSIHKTHIVFNVKIYEENEDLKALASKIFNEINIEGLVWFRNFNLVPIAYGMKMLQIGMIIEDDKIKTEDVFERILEWDEVVQSIDIESMQSA